MSNNSNKKQTKAKINWGWDSPSNRNGGKASRKAKSTSKKALKKIGVLGLILVIIFLIVGLGIGAGVNYFLCKNDCFEIRSDYDKSLGYVWDNNTDTVTINLDNFNSDNLEDYIYQDIGVKAISLGKDVSSEIQVETNLKSLGDNKYTFDESVTKDNLSVLTTKTYYIIYTIPQDLKYGKFSTIQRIRFVYFAPASVESDLNVDVE